MFRSSNLSWSYAILALCALLLVQAQQEMPDEEDPTLEIDDVVSGPMPTPKNTWQAFEHDCNIVATQFGWSRPATQQHMRNQHWFSLFVADFETSFPELFAGSAMARYPGDTATVWIKGLATQRPGIERKIRRFNRRNGMQIKLVEKMRYSVRDQERRMAEVSKALQGMGYGAVGAAMRPGDVLMITMLANDEFPESMPPDRPLELGAGGDYIDPASARLLPAKYDARGILFAFTKKNIDVDEHARGGRQVYSGTHQCTSGFSVKRTSDEKNGITTAAHCTGMSSFDAETPEADFKLYHRDEHCGEYGDVEWKSSDHFELAEYWAGPSDLRDVAGAESAYSVGNIYCVYSRMKGARTCDYVYSTSVTQVGTSGGCLGKSAQKLVAMESDSTVGGDSGGPWSFATEAVGIHKGDKEIWMATRNTFSKASEFGRALGVEILVK